jgi:hypothetical protein
MHERLFSKGEVAFFHGVRTSYTVAVQNLELLDFSRKSAEFNKRPKHRLGLLLLDHHAGRAGWGSRLWRGSRLEPVRPLRPSPLVRSPDGRIPNSLDQNDGVRLQFSSSFDSIGLRLGYGTRSLGSGPSHGEVALVALLNEQSIS